MMMFAKIKGLQIHFDSLRVLDDMFRQVLRLKTEFSEFRETHLLYLIKDLKMHFENLET